MFPHCFFVKASEQRQQSRGITNKINEKKKATGTFELVTGQKKYRLQAESEERGNMRRMRVQQGNHRKDMVRKRKCRGNEWKKEDIRQ